MPYELAKQLKVAGFPQKAQHAFDAQKNLHDFEPYLLNDDHWVAAPALEELIETCDGFISLRRNADRTFAAFGGNHQYPEGSCEQHAPTPTEAVARLWLSLNSQRES